MGEVLHTLRAVLKDKEMTGNYAFRGEDALFLAGAARCGCALRLRIVSVSVDVCPERASTNAGCAET